MAEVAADIERCYAEAGSFVALTRCLTLDTVASRFDAERGKTMSGRDGLPYFDPDTAARRLEYHGSRGGLSPARLARYLDIQSAPAITILRARYRQFSNQHTAAPRRGRRPGAITAGDVNIPGEAKIRPRPQGPTPTIRFNDD